MASERVQAWERKEQEKQTPERRAEFEHHYRNPDDPASLYDDPRTGDMVYEYVRSERIPVDLPSFALGVFHGLNSYGLTTTYRSALKSAYTFEGGLTWRERD